jgi:glutamate-1-semialdehyde 2,1-aminomutase
VPFCTSHAGGMFGFFFSSESKITSFDAVMSCNADHFKQFFHSMLNAGIYLAPSAFEAGFSSAAHSDQDIDDTIVAAGQAFAAIGTGK